MVFLSKHISRTAILTQAPVITCIEFLKFFSYWFYMFNIYIFIFQKIIRKMISVYLLWFDYWTFSVYSCHVYYFFLQDSWICASLEHHSTSFDGLAHLIGILLKWASRLTDLDGDGECRLFGSMWSKIFLKMKFFIIFQACHQIDCLFTWAASSIYSALYSATFVCFRVLFYKKCWS